MSYSRNKKVKIRKEIHDFMVFRSISTEFSIFFFDFRPLYNFFGKYYNISCNFKILDHNGDGLVHSDEFFTFLRAIKAMDDDNTLVDENTREKLRKARKSQAARRQRIQQYRVSEKLSFFFVE